MDLTYRVIFFPTKRAYVAMAWNYAEATMLTTATHEDYTAARAELGKLADKRRATLKWFDGEYHCDEKTEQLLPLR